MGTDFDAAKLLLGEALVAGKSGDWINAIGKRDAAIAQLLGRSTPVPTPRADDVTDELEQLGEKHKPSKRHHDYLRRYWRHFRDRRFEARKVVEVGVETSRSIEMWEEFFPNAHVYGIDIDPQCAAFTGGRRKVYIGDQVNEPFLTDFIAETGGDFDIVIDDGHHSAFSMMKTFSFLYPAMTDHGTYVIEDIQQKPGIISFLRWLMEAVNYIPAGFDLRNWETLSTFSDETPWLVRNTVGVAFYRYIAFIERGFNPQDNPHLLSSTEYQAIIVARRTEVLAGVTALKMEGIPITRENLIQKVGRSLKYHIDRYLSEVGRTVDERLQDR